MVTYNLDQLKFPIGSFLYDQEVDQEQQRLWQQTIADFPKKIKMATESLSELEMNWKYRPEGWSIKQVVHHCADSHMNSFIRFKLALTENTPTIRPYEEHLWAELSDSVTENIFASVAIIEGVHERWTQIMNSFSESDWERMYFHPSSQKLFSLKEALGLYAWHCEHHLAHIYQAIAHKGNFDL